jgi:hypothetical protein
MCCIGCGGVAGNIVLDVVELDGGVGQTAAAALLGVSPRAAVTMQAAIAEV